jgi:RNA polymerase sigma factor (sigma-70 family)
MTNLHPIFYDLVPSVASSITRRYRNWVEKDDVVQECYTWIMTRAEHFTELLNDENELQRKWNEKRIVWQMRRHAERYARREKAKKSGYQINDEAYYDTVTIAQLLPFVIKSYINDSALEQSQILINDGTPKRPSAPAEGGNLLAMLVDIKKAFEALDKDEQEILTLRYHENQTLQLMAEYLECSVSTVDRKINQALRKVQEEMGGSSPW